MKMTAYSTTSIGCERLESRQLWSAVYPTAVEQYMVELLNRARANPNAEAALHHGFIDTEGNRFNGQLNEGLASGTISSASKQPLAVNPYLTDAARTHSQWMIDADTYSHTGSGGSNPGQRMSAAGYSNATTWGENIAINWSSGTLDPATTVFRQHQNLFTDMTIVGRGHRLNMMNALFKEVGVGVATGPWVVGGKSWNALAGTQNFAANNNTYLTGVAYRDNVVVDQFYSVGEGLGGVTVRATRVTDNAVFTTTTWASGGYSLALPAGTYNIQASGGGLASTIYYNAVTIGNQNVKRDFVYGQTADSEPNPSTPNPHAPDPSTPTEPSTPSDPLPPDTPISPQTPAKPETPDFARLVGRTLVIQGTEGDDQITIFRKNTTYFAIRNAQTMVFERSLIDVIAVKSKSGNDLVTIGRGVWATYLEGGDGRDTILGGAGPDTIYGNAQPDSLDGGPGDDLIVGAGGHDLINGADGNDRIYGNAGNDTIDAGIGNDRIFGGQDDDWIHAGSGRDTLFGQAGRDTLIGGSHTDYSDNDPLDQRIAIEILT